LEASAMKHEHRALLAQQQIDPNLNCSVLVVVAGLTGGIVIVAICA
jgi:hypothetical protein